MAAVTKAPVKQTLTYLLGLCVPSTKQNAAKIRVRRLVLDENLHMYFPEYEFLYANDPKKLCKNGDTVLIQNLPQKLTRLITHQVIDVIYPVGAMIDPVTGKEIIGDRYREDITEEAGLFGKLESTFDDTKAPPRGSLEGIRDFSNKKTYVKHHEDPNIPQPYGINP